jgi:PAS domain S-box-containing protein
MNNLFPENSAVVDLRQLDFSYFYENRETLQAILDLIPEGILIARAEDGVPILVNRRGKELRGEVSEYLTLRESCDYWRLEYLDGTCVPFASLPLNRAFRGETVNQEIYRFYQAEGEMQYHLINAGPLCQADGKIFAGIVVFCDITEKWQAEKKLQQSEKKYRELFENASDILYTHDLTGNFISFNKAAERILGYTKRNRTQMTTATVVAPEYHEVVAQHIGQMLRGQEIPAFELEVFARDGHRVALEVNIKLIFEDGKAVGVQGIARDITERKKREHETAILRERFTKAFQNSPFPLAINDTQAGCFIDINDKAAQQLGFLRDEMIGRTPLELGLFSNSETFATLKQRFAQEHKVEDFELTFVTKSGDKRIGLHSAGLIELDGERCILSSTIDITEQRRAERLRAATYKISEAAQTASGLDDLYKEIHLIIAELTAAENFYIALYDPDTDLLKIPYFSDTKTEISRELRLRKGLTLEVLKSGQPLYATPEVFSQFAERGELPNRDVMPSFWLGAPLKIKDETIGVVAVYTYHDVLNLGDEEKEIFVFISNQIAMAIERKRAEQMLRESEERYRLLFERNLAAVYRGTLDGRIVDCNEAYAHLFGYDCKAEVLTLNAKSLYSHKEEREAFIKELQEKGALTNFELRLRKRDGSTVWVMANVHLTPGQDGTPQIIEETLFDITERKTAEENLRASEERFFKAFHANPLHMAVMTFDERRFVEVNDSFIQHSGYLREDIIGRTPEEVGIYAFTEERDKMRQQFAEHKRVKDLEIRFRKRTGKIMTGLFSAEPIMLGDQLCILTSTLDITERKKQEEQLVSAQREWRTTFDAMPDAVILVDAHDRLVRANQAFFERMQLTDEAIGQRVGNILHHNDKFISEEYCLLCQLRATATKGTIELPAGVVTDYPVLASIEPIFDDKGNHTATVEVYRDLTALYLAREEAEQERGSLKTTIEQLAEGLIIFDENGKIVRANQASQNLFGLTLEQMLADEGVNLVDGLFSDKDGRLLAPGEHPVRTVLRELVRINNQVVWYNKPNGERLLLSITVSPWFNEQGKLTGAVSLTRDITEQYREQERLQQADKLRALGQLASGVAHNFNNALAAVIGYSQLAIRKTADHEVQGHLRLIEKSSKDAARMVARIQNFARSYSQQDEFALANISEIVRDAIDITRPRWRYEAEALGKNYSVTLLWQPDEELFINCEPSELREVFVNLIFNALDAMPDGGSLAVRGLRDGKTVHINFEDSGLGMSEEVKNRIFDPFFTTKGAAGLGLGLSESYRIVERHGGHFEVESQLGRGTTFTVILPLSAAPVRARIEAPKIEKSKIHILVIDDEKLVRQALGSILEELGHEVAQASGREEAVALFEQADFDLVVTDLAMPNSDGIAIAEEIKSKKPQIKVILMSGYSPDRVEERVKETTAIDACLSKPYKLDEIHRVIDDLLDRA